MMITGAIGILGLTIIGLVVLYLTQPYYEEFELSAARFFKVIEADSDEQKRWHWANLRASRPFYAQILVFGVLLITLLLSQCAQKEQETADGIGVWFIVDTSASITTVQYEKSRMEIIQEEMQKFVRHLDTLAEDVAVCTHLSTFDLGIKTVLTDAELSVLSGEINSLEAQLLGTNVGLIRQLVNQSSTSVNQQCLVTHFVVLTDRPAPSWAERTADEVPIIWRDISIPVDNAGILSVESNNTLLGGTTDVLWTVGLYGDRVEPIQAFVYNEQDEIIVENNIDWSQTKAQTLSFTPPQAGIYRLVITPSFNYLYDDEVYIKIDSTENLRVDWQAGEHPFLPLQTWQLEAEEPHVRIIDWETVESAELATDIPTMIVGHFYGQAVNDSEINSFEEQSPLLQDLNLDIAESLGIVGINLPADWALHSVLDDTQGQVWVAARPDNQVVYIPGLPSINQDEYFNAFSLTLFFNGLRFLLQESTPPPLYTLTSIANPEPEGIRSTLHRGEGNTEGIAYSSGDFTDIEPRQTVPLDTPIWPQLVAFTALIFAIERLLAGYGGQKWR